jgi:hypothetical protein
LPQREIEALQRQFINSLSRQLRVEAAPGKTTKGPIHLVLDETRYRIWYRGAMKVEFAIWGSDIDKRTRRLEPAIVRWAKSLSRASNNPSRSSVSNRDYSNMLQAKPRITENRVDVATTFSSCLRDLTVREIAHTSQHALVRSG